MVKLSSLLHPTRVLLTAARVLCMFALFFVAALSAEEENQFKTNPIESTLTDTITRKLEVLESDKSVPQETSDQLKILYHDALGNLDRAASYYQVTTGFLRAQDEAPKQTQVLRGKVSETRAISPEQAIREFENLSLEELEPLLLKEKADLAALEAILTKNREALKYHTERPQSIRQRLNEANAEAENIVVELQQPLSSDDSASIHEAKYWVRETQAVALSNEIRMLDKELLSHLQRIDLIKAEIENSAVNLAYVKGRLSHLDDLINEKRSSQASQVQLETEQSQLDTEGQHQAIQQLAERNTELSRQINRYTIELKRVEEDAEYTRKQASQIDQDFKKAQQKLDIAGMSKILGQVLQEQRRALPDTRLYRKKVKQLEQSIAEASLQQLEYKEEYQYLNNLDSYVQKYMLEVHADQIPQLTGSIYKLASDRKEYLSQLISIQNAYIRALSELDFSQVRLVDTASSYDEFLAKNLLWIRSAPISSIQGFSIIPEQLRSLLSPTSWQVVIASLWQRAVNNPSMLIILIVTILLLWKRPYMLAALKATANAVGKPSKDSILFTLQGFKWTFLLALSWPLLLAGTGWQLQSFVSADIFSKAVSLALLRIAEGLLILRMFQLLCAKNGVAARHFKWRAEGLKLLRQDINILMFTFLPLGFIAIVVLNSDISEQGVGLGRLIFVLMMLALTLFFSRIMNPARGALHILLSHGKKTAVIGVRYTWLILAILLPILAALLAILGYLYTASTLVGNFMQTMWLALFLISIQQFVVRWLIVIRGRLVLKAAREKRAAERQAAQLEQENQPRPADLGLELEEQEVDINALSEDSLSLLNLTIIVFAALGIWLIWSDILPALGILNQVTLYQHSIEVAGETVLNSTTLADIGQTILIIFLLVLLVRRLPAFLEIILRQQKSISAGSLYAIKSLTTYALIGIGVMLVFSRLGGVWSDFQWIIAALGVGIGFGLQEIVANFISGLIILFERPIRVGDIVTVGDVSGTVTKIQIRATTIRDWDRKELLVPNKEFITGRLLNWSLSDSVTRLTTTIGVAYGSDVELAMRIIEEAAHESDMILDTPQPDVAFKAFGDNTLNLSARVYIDNIDYRVSALSELHRVINKKFNEAGIVIAFPQRDVHLDTSQPLEIRISK